MYVDVCIIHGEGKRLRLVFTYFREKRILIESKKCKFGPKQVIYDSKLIS